MQEISERVKIVRKTLGLSGEKFGERLCITKSSISNIESGNRNLTEQNINAICREFNVNEDWLRNGNGEMFVDLSLDEEIRSFITKLLDNTDDDFKTRLISAIRTLDEHTIKGLLGFIEILSK